MIFNCWILRLFVRILRLLCVFSSLYIDDKLLMLPDNLLRYNRMYFSFLRFSALFYFSILLS